jgi:hypothetical protein
MWYTHVRWLKPDAKDIELNQDEFLLKHYPLPSHLCDGHNKHYFNAFR